MKYYKNEIKLLKPAYYLLLGLIGLLAFTSPVILAEEHSHEEKEEHQQSEHKDHDSHDHEEDHEEDHDDHKEESADHDDHEDEDEDEHGHNHAEPATDVELTKQQMQKAGIQTMQLTKQSVSQQIKALSEIRLNQYKTIKVSPSITTRVEKRHVHIGDRVKKGDLLVTLHTIATTDMSANVLATADLAASSAELAANIAQAKGELAAASARWQRIQSLGKDAVSGKRYTEARIAKQQAQARLDAYGKSQQQVKKLVNSGSKAVQKHFKLRAEQAGTVIKDDFVLGQVVNPEDVLFEISDMDHLWVEANIKPKEVSHIKIGSVATIQIETDSTPIKGKVIYIGRVLDEKTRTLPVRIEVDTAGIALYPGQFVKTSISSSNTQTAITLPAEAVIRGSDGDWTVFVEQAAGRFIPKEVEIIENLGDKVTIEASKDVDVGTTIISKGLFFVQSELGKSGFAVHNH